MISLEGFVGDEIEVHDSECINGGVLTCPSYTTHPYVALRSAMLYMVCGKQMIFSLKGLRSIRTIRKVSLHPPLGHDSPLPNYRVVMGQSAGEVTHEVILATALFTMDKETKGAALVLSIVEKKDEEEEGRPAARAVMKWKEHCPDLWAGGLRVIVKPRRFEPAGEAYPAGLFDFKDPLDEYENRAYSGQLSR